MQYRKEVDGLRALAVVPVILFHAGFAWFGGGFVGVDVFFVISGYLITSAILSDLEKGRFSIANFYERRARRILPALFLVMAACVPPAWWWLLPSDMNDFSQSVVAVSVFASNILFWQKSGYFDVVAEMRPLLHTWSLAVEEQFYVLFPLFLTATWRFGRKITVLLVGVVLIASLALTQWAVFREPVGTFFLLPTRGWELLIGALTAFVLARRTSDTPSTVGRQILGGLGLTLLAISVFAFDEKTPFPSVYGLVPTVGTALIILFAQPGTFAGNLLGHRVFVGIGLVSYSPYLWHQPLFAFARHREIGHPGPLTFAVLSVLSLVLAYFSWRYVEQPFRRKGFLTRERIFGLSALVSAVFIAFGLAGYATQGFLKLKLNDAQRQVLTTATASERRAECHTKGANYLKPAAACEYFVKGGTWATFGDSHTVELAYALARQLQPLGEGLRQFSFSGCRPSLGRIDADRFCSQWTEEAVRHVVQNPSIKTVVVSYRIHSALFGDHEATYPELPKEGSDSEREAIWQSYVELLRRFVQADKTVYLVLQSPELPRSVETLIQRHSDPRDIAGVNPEWWQARSAFVRERLGQLPKGVVIIDPAPLFCDAQSCAAVRAGTALYFDSHHLSVSGADIVAAEVVRRTDVRMTSPGSSESDRQKGDQVR